MDNTPAVPVTCAGACCTDLTPTPSEPTASPVASRQSPRTLDEEITLNQGTTCIVPDCNEPWADKAHIEASGMGGRPSTYNAHNLVGLCRPHHDIFDGRDLQGRQHLLRQLMRSLADQVRAQRHTMRYIVHG